MAAYLIGRIKVSDFEAYKKYTAKSPGAIKNNGGRFLVRGGEVVTVEGEAEDARIVVVEFDNMEAAKAFYNSEEYQAIIPLRTAVSTGQMLLVDGVD